jgi:hypothetical protein
VKLRTELKSQICSVASTKGSWTSTQCWVCRHPGDCIERRHQRIDLCLRCALTNTKGRGPLCSANRTTFSQDASYAELDLAVMSSLYDVFFRLQDEQLRWLLSEEVLVAELPPEH